MIKSFGRSCPKQNTKNDITSKKKISQGTPTRKAIADINCREEKLRENLPAVRPNKLPDQKSKRVSRIEFWEDAKEIYK